MEVAIMVYIRRSFLISIGILIMMFVAACGNNTGTGSRYGSGSSGSTPTTGGSVIKTATATINSKAETILTNAQGMTLYYRTSDTATSVCNGGCAQVWPPLLFTGSGTPGSSASLAGSLTVSTDANEAELPGV